jgi:DNA end-binding protein Ku
MPYAASPFVPPPAAGGPDAHHIPVATACPGRASWSGFLRFRLVTVPVKGFPRIAPPEEVELHLLHVGCGRRIGLQKHCPAHGPVEAHEVVKGYQYAPGQYVPLDAADLERLRPTPDKMVSLEQVLEPGALEPALFSGRSFSVLPDGPAAQRPFAVLAEALRTRGKWALGRAVQAGRRCAVLVRPAGQGLALDVLHDPARLKVAGDGSPVAVAVAAEELTLAGLLLDSAGREIRWPDFRDDTAERLAALVAAKRQSRPFPAPPPEEVPTLPLLDALRQSLARGQRAKGRQRPAAPRRCRRKTPGQSD